MMRTLIDSRTLQAWHHLHSDFSVGKRLAGFLEELQAVPEMSGVEFTEDLSQLSSCELLVIPTRIKEPYTDHELAAIRDFVEKGGRLLLLSNHQPFHELDGQIAELWNISLEPTHFGPKSGLGVMGEHCLSDHPITAKIVASKGELYTSSTCSIIAPEKYIAVRLPNTMRNKATGCEPHNQAFCVAFGEEITGSDCGGGRVVITADSGWICSCDMQADGLGAGLLEHGSNRLFLREIFRWLFAC